ncbi:MAG: 6-carboxytetrahydropterin synthase QueD, partial [Candidatus Cloacimonadaceae bacterium]|nr:6-carboxytetrahydropterin synthase QueD [Candidatus Cloacimonadaceae bacterium]
MYKLNVTDSFSAAHMLCGYEGACSNLHGHNWSVRIGLLCSELDNIGMAMDFGVIKQMLKAILDEFDHKFLNDLPAFFGSNPTSENLASYIFSRMQKELQSSACAISEVEIW